MGDPVNPQIIDFAYEEPVNHNLFHPAADHFAVRELEERLEKVTRAINALAPEVGEAKQVREYDSDRRKNLLARFAAMRIEAGDSAAAAETLARAEQNYQEGFESLGEQRKEAERVIAKWDAFFALYEATRSQLSLQKEVIRAMPE